MAAGENAQANIPALHPQPCIPSPASPARIPIPMSHPRIPGGAEPGPTPRHLGDGKKERAGVAAAPAPPSIAAGWRMDGLSGASRPVRLPQHRGVAAGPGCAKPAAPGAGPGTPSGAGAGPRSPLHQTAAELPFVHGRCQDAEMGTASPAPARRNPPGTCRPLELGQNSTRCTSRRIDRKSVV